MDNDKAMIPYFAHEGEMVRMERVVKRLWITVILLIGLLVGTNGAWLWYESQFEYYTTTIEQESESGTNNYIGNDGDISYGETDSYNDR